MTSRSREEANPLLAAALAYAARGWRVFPLVPRNKNPLTSAGFKDATTSRHQVLLWWQAIPDANIGLATGDPFDVLDLDSPDAVRDLQMVLGHDYRHAGPTVLTGKGFHLYYAASGLRNRAGLLSGRIDFRGTGGYVVGPPSVHPSGRVYEWAPNRGPSLLLPTLHDNLIPIIEKPKAAPPAPRIAIRAPDGSFRLIGAAATIAARPNIIEVAQGLGLEVYPHGALWATNCIFHNDPGPSMVLYTRDNSFHCFGCEAHGDSNDLRAKRDMTGKVGLTA